MIVFFKYALNILYNLFLLCTFSPGGLPLLFVRPSQGLNIKKNHFQESPEKPPLSPTDAGALHGSDDDWQPEVRLSFSNILSIYIFCSSGQSLLSLKLKELLKVKWY